MKKDEFPIDIKLIRIYICMFEKKRKLNKKKPVFNRSEIFSFRFHICKDQVFEIFVYYIKIGQKIAPKFLVQFVYPFGFNLIFFFCNHEKNFHNFGTGPKKSRDLILIFFSFHEKENNLRKY